MVTRSEAFPSRYWKADDLPEEGVTLKVAKLEIDQIGPDREEKYVLYFKGQDKRLVLNVTNWDLIACFCGADSNSWTGKEVVLFPTTTTFGSKTMPCVRVRRTRTVAPSMATRLDNIAGKPAAQRQADEPPPVEDESEFA
jgi:hypothetical protein